MEQEYKYALGELIAYCQRQGILPTDSAALIEELAIIFGWGNLDVDCFLSLLDE